MLDPTIELVPNLVRGHRRDGRCLYDKSAKCELVRRCLEPGVSLAGLALAHGLNANLLHKWVETLSGKVRPRRVRALSGPSAVLLPVKVEECGATGTPSAHEGYVEIVLAGGTVRAHGRVEVEWLRTVLDCVASRA